MLQIYNSVTKSKQPLKPVHPGKISLYVCGVTVYDFCHIGHARTYATFDLLYRYLKSLEQYDVRYVRNITDVDDKIIKRASENGETCEALTARFIDAMHEDFNALGFLSPDKEPKATETMAEMILMIEKLLAAGHAYIATNGDVYFDTQTQADYGLLAQQDLSTLQAGARVEVAHIKKNPLDFVLWKKADDSETVVWPSPWGNGRPGWHIECSAMSTHYLGDTLDIHGGGNDLKFPHHENERAQAECCTGKTFVNTWMHVGFVQINDEKMSKSLGNFFTIRDVLKHYDAETVRFFLLANHYRSPINYSQESLNQARASLETLYTSLRGLELSSITLDKSSRYFQTFQAAMDDDLNMPIVLSLFFEIAREINSLKQQDKLSDALYCAHQLKALGNLIGFLQQSPEQFLQFGLDDDFKKQVELLIQKRADARKAKEWAVADEMRKKLDEMHVLLEDSAEGTTWRLKR